MDDKTSNDNLSIGAKFNNLAAIKKQQAAEYQAKEKAERDRNNILLRWKAIRNGTVLSDESTQAELELYASVSDISLLGLDDEGHICLLSSLQKDQQEEKPQEQPKPELSEKPPEQSGQDNAVFETAAQQRRAALAAAMKAAQQTTEPAGEDAAAEAADDAQTPHTEEEVSGDNGSSVQLPAFQEESDEEDATPVNEDAMVLRVENIGVNEARIYIVAKSNPDTNESAYGLYVEQGYGENRQVFVQGERVFNSSAKNMAFRAAMVALTPYSRLGQPIRQVYVFMERELGWILMKNSWNLVTEAYSLDAETYCQTFKACAGRDVTIRFAPAEAHSIGQKKANDICDTLIHIPN